MTKFLAALYFGLFIGTTLSNAGKKTAIKTGSIECSKAFEALVADGKMSKEFAHAVQGLIDAGPEKWVAVKGEGISGLVFQRGVSGALGLSAKPKPKHLESGAQDAITVLLGEGNSQEVHTSVLPSLNDSADYMFTVNRAFSFPLTVRGPAKAVGLSEPTKPDISSPAIIDAGGLVPSNISSMGFFFQNMDSGKHN